MAARDNTPEDTSKLWFYYNSGWAAKMPERTVQILCSTTATNVCGPLEGEICKTFLASKNVDCLYFLGLCNGAESREILVSAASNSISAVAGAAQLALARRGDRDFEARFIAQFTIAYGSTNQALYKYPFWQNAIFSLLYIGSAESMGTLFDVALPSTKFHQRKAYMGAFYERIDPSDMRVYLAKAGIQIPKTVVTEEDLCLRWKENRAETMTALRAIDPVLLPRLPFMGIRSSIIH